jgi:hypothetical protein
VWPDCQGFHGEPYLSFFFRQNHLSHRDDSPPRRLAYHTRTTWITSRIFLGTERASPLPTHPFIYSPPRDPAGIFSLLGTRYTYSVVHTFQVPAFWGTRIPGTCSLGGLLRNPELTAGNVMLLTSQNGQKRACHDRLFWRIVSPPPPCSSEYTTVGRIFHSHLISPFYGPSPQARVVGRWTTPLRFRDFKQEASLRSLSDVNLSTHDLRTSHKTAPVARVPPTLLSPLL